MVAGAQVLPLMVFRSTADKVDRLKRLIALQLYDPDAREIADAMLRDPLTRAALGVDARWHLPTPSRASWPAPMSRPPEAPATRPPVLSVVSDEDAAGPRSSGDPGRPRR